jgi:hypothetical protein
VPSARRMPQGRAAERREVFDQKHSGAGTNRNNAATVEAKGPNAARPLHPTCIWVARKGQPVANRRGRGGMVNA